MRFGIAAVWALMRRGLYEVVRVPGAAIPGVLAPTVFLLGLTSLFGSLTVLPGFSADSYMAFILPVCLLQGAAFSGAATGVNLARDIEQGWLDRLLASPAPRYVLLAGTVLSASLRALMPLVLALAVALALGVPFPGAVGLGVAVGLVAAFATAAASFGVALALRFRTQSAAPLMQAGMFMAVLCTTAYAPQELLSGWLREVAAYNPVTPVLEAARQGFVGDVTWQGTWPGLVALAGLAAVLTLLAMRGLYRTGR